MKAEDYVCEWCDKIYKGGKELEDWTSDEVMQFANDYAQERTKVCYPKEFVEWKDRFTGFDIEHELYTVEIETHVIELMELSQLFLYWRDKIK